MTNLKHIASLLLALLVFSIASVNATESITYIHTDHLGSPIAATNEDGSVKWTEDYQPFGVQRTNQDSDNTTGFTGHQHDDALDLTYMQARWYHPEVGRFMALDPIVFRASDLSSFGRYTYAANNPYYYVDPDGRENMAKFDQNVFFNWKGAEGVKLYNSQMRNFDPETAKGFLPGMGVVDGIESFDNGNYLIGIAMVASEVPILKFLKAFKVANKGLGGNPFKGKSFEQIDKTLTDRGFRKVGDNPAGGQGSYFHPETGRKYYLDKGKGGYKKGMKENPHVDVHRMRNGKNIESDKRKYPTGDKLYEKQ